LVVSCGWVKEKSRAFALKLLDTFGKLVIKAKEASAVVAKKTEAAIKNPASVFL